MLTFRQTKIILCLNISKNLLEKYLEQVIYPSLLVLCLFGKERLMSREILTRPKMCQRIILKASFVFSEISALIVNIQVYVNEF